MGAHIYGFARQLLQERLNEVKAIFPTSKLFMVNTDSCVVSIPRDKEISTLSISSEMGFWKHQIKDCHEILKFFSLSAVAYHITYVSKKGELEQMSKIAGFCLKTMLAPGIDANDFEYLLKKAISGEKAEIKIEQFRKKSQSGYASEETRIQFCLRSSFDDKRVNLDDFNTCPFGFRD